MFDAGDVKLAGVALCAIAGVAPVPVGDSTVYDIVKLADDTPTLTPVPASEAAHPK